MKILKSGPTKERIHYIDLMESVAMLFVVAYHLSNLPYKPLEQLSLETCFNYYIRCFFVVCVPLFLVTNGYLLFHHSLDMKRHLKKTGQYVVLTLFWGVMTQIAYNHVNGVAFQLKQFLSEMFTWRYGVIHLWYMGALVIIYLMFPILKLVYDKNRKLLLYLAAVLSVVTFGNRLINHIVTVLYWLRGTPVSWVLMKNWFSMFNPVADIPGYTLVYFCLGAFLDDFIAWLKKFPRKKTCFAAAAVMLLAAAVHGVGFTLLCVATDTYCCSIWYGYETITGFVITLCAVVLFVNYKGTWKPGARILQLVSTNTLGIYFMHMVIVHLLRPRVYAIPALCNLPMNLILSAVVIGVCLGVTLLLRKIPLLKKLIS